MSSVSLLQFRPWGQSHILFQINAFNIYMSYKKRQLIFKNCVQHPQTKVSVLIFTEGKVSFALLINLNQNKVRKLLTHHLTLYIVILIRIANIYENKTKERTRLYLSGDVWNLSFQTVRWQYLQFLCQLLLLG